MTIQILECEGGQMVRLPTGFEFTEKEVTIRREGNAIVLEPVKPKTWPPEFFEQIRIDDPKFKRPPQGEMPPVPVLGSK